MAKQATPKKLRKKADPPRIFNKPADLDDVDWSMLYRALERLDVQVASTRYARGIDVFKANGNTPILRQDFLGPSPGVYNNWLRAAKSPFRIGILGTAKRSNPDCKIAIVCYEDGILLQRMPRGKAPAVVEVTVNRTSLDLVPKFDIYSVMAQTERGEWPETVGSKADLDHLLLGIKIGVSLMNGQLNLVELSSEATLADLIDRD